MAYGSIVFSFTSNVEIGAFYAGIVAVVTACVSYFANSHGFLGALIICCAASAILNLIGTLIDGYLIYTIIEGYLIGTIIDGIAYSIFGYIKACGNDSLQFWGDSSYYDAIIEKCELPEDTHDCYCIISQTSTCYKFDAGDGFDKDDCNPLVDEYGHLIHISWSLCLAMFFLSLILFVIGCASCCTTYNRFKTDKLMDQQHIREDDRQNPAFHVANATLPPSGY